MSSPTKLAIVAIFTGFGAFAALIAAVFLTGSTFGQRCARLLPAATQARHDQCVSNLSKDRPA